MQIVEVCDIVSLELNDDFLRRKLHLNDAFLRRFTNDTLLMQSGAVFLRNLT